MNDFDVIFKVSGICNAKEVEMEVQGEFFVLRKYEDVGGHPCARTRAYRLSELKERYKNLNECVDDFLKEFEEGKREIQRKIIEKGGDIK